MDRTSIDINKSGVDYSWNRDTEFNFLKRQSFKEVSKSSEMNSNEEKIWW